MAAIIVDLPWSFHDGGRAHAGFKDEAEDCAIRACSIALGFPYIDVYTELFRIQKEYFKRSRLPAIMKLAKRDVGACPMHGVQECVVHRYLTSHGAVWVPYRAKDSVVEAHQMPERFPLSTVVLFLMEHAVAMKDGVVFDTGPILDREPVQGVWIMPSHPVNHKTGEVLQGVHTRL